MDHIRIHPIRRAAVALAGLAAVAAVTFGEAGNAASAAAQPRVQSHHVQAALQPRGLAAVRAPADAAAAGGR